VDRLKILYHQSELSEITPAKPPKSDKAYTELFFTKMKMKALSGHAALLRDKKLELGAIITDLLDTIVEDNIIADKPDTNESTSKGSTGKPGYGHKKQGATSPANSSEPGGKLDGSAQCKQKLYA
jgi:hypothetical protein